jgi:hypothetical protein
MNKMSNKKDQLKDKEVALVKEFVRTEGSITPADIEALFGYNRHQEIATALAELPISFS